MTCHTIKREWDDGNKLPKPLLWCGKEFKGGFVFSDTHHLALSVGGSIQPCKNCIKAIIKKLEEEL